MNQLERLKTKHAQLHDLVDQLESERQIDRSEAARVALKQAKAKRAAIKAAIAVLEIDVHE